ncbi:MAG: HigA family addiction module antitoxin [Eggerthellaceae bacterium]|nr:HigA family addiction module antitoxin [Eggerthellaceae bacterium]
MTSEFNIDNMLLISRKPTHPGEMLREEFMPDFGLSVAALAKHLAVSRQTVNELVHERRAVSPEMALRLARVFGTTPQYWLNMQRNVDLWDSLDLHADQLAEVVPLQAAVVL